MSRTRFSIPILTIRAVDFAVPARKPWVRYMRVGTQAWHRHPSIGAINDENCAHYIRPRRSSHIPQIQRYTFQLAVIIHLAHHHHRQTFVWPQLQLLQVPKEVPKMLPKTPEGSTGLQRPQSVLQAPRPTMPSSLAARRDIQACCLSDLQRLSKTLCF